MTTPAVIAEGDDSSQPSCPPSPGNRDPPGAAPPPSALAEGTPNRNRHPRGGVGLGNGRPFPAGLLMPPAPHGTAAGVEADGGGGAPRPDGPINCEGILGTTDDDDEETIPVGSKDLGSEGL